MPKKHQKKTKENLQKKCVERKFSRSFSRIKSTSSFFYRLKKEVEHFYNFKDRYKTTTSPSSK